ncbi:MAG: efflux RND transporter periplasmic adaptor subunit, partial [Clostridiales bacterium]|nr:efflux RND transporter periplasmic adaptor subunit [Clostridiales bacterium]
PSVTVCPSIKISEQQSDLETAKSGIVAEFSGVVSDVAVVEGQTVTEGLQLFTLNSTENVIVKFNVSKYELETLELGQKADVIVSGNTYQGTVTKISKMATLNASGTAMIAAEVTVENPDEAIYLGIEAKITIYTEEATNAVLVPIEAVNADKDGDFCYVVVNGIVERRNVTVGISSDLLIEIKEGIKVGDQVVKSGMTDATEGSMVTAITEVTEE